MSEGGRLLERTVRDMRTGDVVVYGGRDFLVEGVIAYDEDGHRWVAARMIDGKDVQWMLVGFERLGPTTVRILREDDALELSGYPPEVLIAGDLRHALDRRGTASARFHGNVGRLPGSGGARRAAETVERCRWWLYEAAGDHTLMVEQWAGEYRALRGQKVAPGVVELIPGS